MLMTDDRRANLRKRSGVIIEESSTADICMEEAYIVQQVGT